MKNSKPNSKEKTYTIIGENCDIIRNDKYPYDFLISVPAKESEFNILIEFGEGFDKEELCNGSLNIDDFMSVIALRKARNLDEYITMYDILKNGNVKLIKISENSHFNVKENGLEADFSLESPHQKSIVFNFRLTNKKYLNCLKTLTSEIAFQDLKLFWPSINIRIKNYTEMKISLGLYSDLFINLV